MKPPRLMSRSRVKTRFSPARGFTFFCFFFYLTLNCAKNHNSIGAQDLIQTGVARARLPYGPLEAVAENKAAEWTTDCSLQSR